MTVPIREPEQIRQDSARKLRSVRISDHFQAIFGCLLDEDGTTLRLIGMQITPDGHLLVLCEAMTNAVRDQRQLRSAKSPCVKCVDDFVLVFGRWVWQESSAD